jgi:hypothetical protein
LTIDVPQSITINASVVAFWLITLSVDVHNSCTTSGSPSSLDDLSPSKVCPLILGFHLRIEYNEVPVGGIIADFITKHYF